MNVGQAVTTHSILEALRCVKRGVGSVKVTVYRADTLCTSPPVKAYALDAPQSSRLLDALAHAPDPRHRRGQRHPWRHLVIIIADPQRWDGSRAPPLRAAAGERVWHGAWQHLLGTNVRPTP